MPKELSIIFKPDGTVEIEAGGFQGKECLKATAGIEKALGITPENSKRVMKKEGVDSAVRAGNRNRVQS